MFLTPKAVEREANLGSWGPYGPQVSGLGLRWQSSLALFSNIKGSRLRRLPLMFEKSAKLQCTLNGKYPNETLRFHYENAPGQRSGIVVELLGKQNIQLIPHPPYSPDLVPFNLWLFPHVKDHLRGKRYDSRSQLE